MKLHQNSLLQVHPHEILMPGGGEGGGVQVYFTVCYLRFQVRRAAAFTWR